MTRLDDCYIMKLTNAVTMVTCSDPYNFMFNINNYLRFIDSDINHFYVIFSISSEAGGQNIFVQKTIAFNIHAY